MPEGNTDFVLRSAFANILCGLVLAMSVASTSTARTIVIDSFETDQSTVVFTPATLASNQASGAGIIGGERDITVTLSSGVGVTGVASAGTYSYGHIAGSEGTVSMIWDGVDGSQSFDPTGLGGADLTDEGLNDAFGLSLLFNDFTSPLSITVYSDGSNASRANGFLPGNIPPDPQTVFEILFSEFSVILGSGADFAAVGAVVLEIDGSATAGLDVELDYFNTVVSAPEPTPLLLMVGGLVGFAWIRRRRFAV